MSGKANKLSCRMIYHSSTNSSRYFFVVRNGKNIQADALHPVGCGLALAEPSKRAWLEPKPSGKVSNTKVTGVLCEPLAPLAHTGAPK